MIIPHPALVTTVHPRKITADSTVSEAATTATSAPSATAYYPNQVPLALSPVSASSSTSSMSSSSSSNATATAPVPIKPSLFQSMGLGGMSACFAVNFTHPIETVKTRMQASGGSIGETCSQIIKSEGVASFWKGLPFAYGRELSYTSIKLGAYAPVRDAIGAGRDAPFYLKFLAGAITGGVGSVAGNPFDVLKTLAQTNKEKAVPLGALVSRMYSDQGVGGFYRGVEVNVMRACVLNATKMGVYDISKGFVSEKTGWKRKDVRTAFSSAFIAGFFMTCTVAPWDMLRTKLMNQPTDRKLYNGFSDCLVQTVKKDGVLSLWRGFIPIWARFAPQATLQLLTIEFLYGVFGFKSI